MDRERGRETGGRAGLFLALSSLLNSSFILPVHSVLLSIAPVTRRSIHCLILPPLHLPHTHPDPIPSPPGSFVYLPGACFSCYSPARRTAIDWTTPASLIHPPPLPSL